MRATSAGVTRRSEPAPITVDGRVVNASAGDTIAAALLDAGIRTCRVTANGDARGVFCGMGVCQECVVVADGVPTRACMTPVRAGMRIEFASDAYLAPPAAPRLEPVSLAPDVLVVGAGPGGLAAAVAAAEAGADVVVVDERTKPGGQYYKQPSEAFEVDERALDGQYRAGRELAARVEAAGATVLSGVQVWAAAGPNELRAVGGGCAYTIRPDRLILATGAYERSVPLPGWTLPGFMATGAAQTLLRAYQVVPGGRVLVSGNGPLNLQVAAELVRAGATVVALCETAAVASPRRARAVAQMAAAAPDLIRTGISYAWTLRAARVPVLYRHSVVRAEGDGRVERATVARLDARGRVVRGTEVTFAVDTVCAGFGFLPSNELARSVGVAHAWDESAGQLVAVRAPDGRTSVPGVWVVGDGGGTGGARLAQAVGFLAGAAAARVAPPAGVEHARRRNERFQRGLRRLHAAPRLVDQLAEPETLVCRCEGVSLAAVDDALAGGIAAIGALKRVTRAGMGRCQARYCGALLAELAARRSPLPLDDNAWFAPAVPFKPLPVELAAAALEPVR